MKPHQIALDILWRHEADITAMAKTTEYKNGPNHYSRTMHEKAANLRETIALLKADTPQPASTVTVERYGNQPPAMWPLETPIASLTR